MAKKTAVSNVSTLDVKNPIPFEPTGSSSPFLFSNKKKGYLPFLDPKDNFFQLLLEAKILSPTNDACVNSKTNFCIGNGLYIKDEKANNEAFLEFTKHVNKKGQTLDDILESIFNNHFTVGNNFVEIIRGKVGQKKFIRVINRPFLDCRLSEPNDEDICESVFISKRFRKQTAWTFKDHDSVELPIYYGEDTKWWKDSNGYEHCIMHLKNDFPGYDYYGMPDNVSSLPWQLLEYKMARYNLDILENNLVVGGIIFLEGNVSSEEGKKVGQDVIFSHTGDGKRGRWTVVAGGNDISKSAVHEFNNQTEGSYLKMDDNVEGKIVDSNNWDSTLYGQHQSGGLGSNGFAYLSSIFDTKNRMVIQPVQNKIISTFLKPLLKIHDEWVGTKLSDLDIGFQSVSPASFVGNINVNNVLKVNEARGFIGLTVDPNEPNGNEYVGGNVNLGNISKQ